VHLALGGHSGIPDDSPFEADFIVESLSDGAIRSSGPYYGSSAMDLGPSACLRIGGIQIVCTSHKAQMADLEMFRFVGIEPRDKSILVVKSSVHFRAAFAPLAGEILICIAPGSMPVDTSALPWSRLAPDVRRRPKRRPSSAGREG
jgi:microcystin degradation protein MlrC